MQQKYGNNAEICYTAAMKIIAAVLCLFLPVIASAQGATQLAPAAPKYEIIDGKKFFMLNSARRMPASSGNALSPGAQAVMNHPRADYRVPVSERLAMTPVSRAPYAPAAPNAPLAAGEAPYGKSDSVKNELLSIFSPDDRSIPAPATK